MNLRVYCDGLYEPRYRPDGWACWAWIAIDDAGKVFAQDYGCLGRGRERYSANVAEYHAVGRALRWLRDNDYAAEVFSDSQLIVYQSNGGYQCNAEHLQPLCARVKELLREMPAVTLTWIRREENELADKLVNLAYREARNAAA